MAAESDTEKTVCRFAKDHGISTLKLNGEGSRGKLDRLFMRQGKAVFCELKAYGETMSPLQRKFRRDRIVNGFDAECFDNPSDAIAWLKKVFSIE